MSVLRPAAKKPHIVAATAPIVSSPLTQTQQSLPVEKNHPTVSPQQASSEMMPRKVAAAARQNHPKGHKPKEISEIWKTMDSQAYLHLTDTLTLSDVWVQPINATPATSGPFVNVLMREVIFAPHIKYRDAVTKMSIDDLLKILYLNEQIQWKMQGITEMTFEEWLNEKSSICVKAKGLEEGSNRAKLCNYILTEDRGFTFYPEYLRGIYGFFFRKICYHSYKTGKKGEEKMLNPSMIKCCAVRGTFEYILEAQLFMLPSNWDISPFTTVDTTEVPESQPLSL